jgi:hypothetical protein
MLRNRKRLLENLVRFGRLLRIAVQLSKSTEHTSFSFAITSVAQFRQRTAETRFCFGRAARGELSQAQLKPCFG